MVEKGLNIKSKIYYSPDIIILMDTKANKNRIQKIIEV